jgi:HK97 family phage portal protein
MGLISLLRTGSWNNELVRSSSSNSFLSGGIWQSSKSKAGTSITKNNATSIPAVYAAVKVITEAFSTLPMHIMTDTGTNKTKNKAHPVYKLFSREPNALMTISTFWKIVIPEVLLWGNSFSIIEFEKGSFRPKSILPVHPSKVEVEIKDGILWYTFKLENTTITLDQTNVLHFRGLGDNVLGQSVIDVAKENLGLGMAAEEFGSRFFGNGASMTGVLQSDNSLSDKAFNNLKASFNDLHGGISNANKPLILEEGLKYTATSIPPDSAQFLETRRFSVEDVSRWFNIPADKIGDLSRATFSNLEQQNQNFITNTLMPYVINIESECTRKLIREVEKDTTYFKMNLNGLLRGDIKTRTDSYRTLFNIGAMTVNEIRSLEEMNPVEGGDSRYVPMNLGIVDEEGNNQPLAVPVVEESEGEPKNEEDEKD